MNILPLELVARCVYSDVKSAVALGGTSKTYQKMVQSKEFFEALISCYDQKHHCMPQLSNLSYKEMYRAAYTVDRKTCSTSVKGFSYENCGLQNEEGLAFLGLDAKKLFLVHSGKDEEPVYLPKMGELRSMRYMNASRSMDYLAIYPKPAWPISIYTADGKTHLKELLPPIKRMGNSVRQVGFVDDLLYFSDEDSDLYVVNLATPDAKPVQLVSPKLRSEPAYYLYSFHKKFIICNQHPDDYESIQFYSLTSSNPSWVKLPIKGILHMPFEEGVLDLGYNNEIFKITFQGNAYIREKLELPSLSQDLLKIGSSDNRVYFMSRKENKVCFYDVVRNKWSEIPLKSDGELQDCYCTANKVYCLFDNQELVTLRFSPYPI